MSPFRIVSESKHGPAVASDNPKLDAYRQKAWNARRGLVPCDLTMHACGCVTVATCGLMPTTYLASDACLVETIIASEPIPAQLLADIGAGGA